MTSYDYLKQVLFIRSLSVTREIRGRNSSSFGEDGSALVLLPAEAGGSSVNGAHTAWKCTLPGGESYQDFTSHRSAAMGLATGWKRFEGLGLSTGGRYYPGCPGCFVHQRLMLRKPLRYMICIWT